MADAAPGATIEPGAPRCAALVGSYLSGKTTLLDALLHVAGAGNGPGAARNGDGAGDITAEARSRQMSTELSVGCCIWLGDPWTFLDCPGSIELAQEALNALMVADIAVVVAEPFAEKAVTLTPLLKFLADHDIPHVVYINKMDEATESVADILEALQAVSPRPLALREVPIRDGERVTGFVDLASERAWQYQEGQPSRLIEIPATAQHRELQARNDLLETLADFDDELLAQLLEDATPPPDVIYQNLTRDLQAGHIVPVFFGSALHANGMVRLFKALRHEAPAVEQAATRNGVDPDRGVAAVRLCKTWHQPHVGKVSLGRVLSGAIKDGETLNGERVSGIYRLHGAKSEKLTRALIGEVVGLGRMDGVRTGDLLAPQEGAHPEAAPWPAPLPPLYSLALSVGDRGDEVKLSGALARTAEEDPSVVVEHDPVSKELRLGGQGDIHLSVALERLKRKFNLDVLRHRPQVGYKETIRKSTSQHARFKRQTGGHGQFADIRVEIGPLARGAGFEFEDSVVGGAIPRQFIPSVEAGVRDYLKAGPLGFELVDLHVELTDGQHHSVDSSDAAFRTAGRMAMAEGIPACDPVLLEPIWRVEVAVPSAFTPKVQRLLSSRRGQILGFDTKQGWPGWDEIRGLLPHAEMHDLIIELRSLSLGVGTYAARFDHLQELRGKLADQVVSQHAAA
ncbi:MAG: elongation factor G [Acetobacterales bacterium]